MFKMGRRVVFAAVVCSLAIHFGQTQYIPVKRVANTNESKIDSTIRVHEEQETSSEVYENKEQVYEELLVEADKAIVDTEKLINQYDEMKLPETENPSGKSQNINVILASRGGHIGEKPSEKAPWYNFSHEELNLMAQVIQAEAGGEPYEGQVAVANVIFNRVKAGWGETVTEVLTQAGQFTKTRKEPSDSVFNAINEALYGKNEVPEGTLFFQNLDISKDFTIPNTKEYVTKVGRHTFYR